MDGVRRAYGGLAGRYIDLFDTIDAISEDDRLLIERHLANTTGVVLDVGCGPGRLTEHLRAAFGVETIGLDHVSEFITHARTTYPDSRYQLGSMRQLPMPDHAAAGMLSWYSLIHFEPDELDAVLVELRRVLTAGATFVVGFFDGDDVAPFDHKVTTAYFWPADEMSARLQRAGFTEVERLQRPSVSEAVPRPQAAIAAVAV